MLGAAITRWLKNLAPNISVNNQSPEYSEQLSTVPVCLKDISL